MIHQTTVAGLEDTLFHTDADDGVGIEGLAQDIGPLSKRQSLHTALHSLDVGLVLHMVGDALVTGLRPCVVILMTTEPGIEGGFILSRLLPYLTVADLIDQETVVVLLNQVFHVTVDGS